MLAFFPAAFTKEPVQQLGGIGCEQAFFYADAMIQKLGISQAEFAAHASETEIPGSEDKPVDSGEHDCPRAHDAGFQTHVKCAIWQAIVLQMRRSLAQSLYFGVRGWVGRGNRQIPPLSNHCALMHNDRSNRYFARGKRLASQVNRETHVSLVSFRPRLMGS
jgi:hypothetical protein